DPRVHLAPGVLDNQLAVAKKIWNAMAEDVALTQAVGDSQMGALHVADVGAGLAKLMIMTESADRSVPAPVLEALADFQAQLDSARQKSHASVAPRRLAP